MKVAFVFHMVDSMGGAERRLIRVYNSIGKTSGNIACDIIVRGCKIEQVKRILEKADCKIDSINHVYAFKNQYLCLFFLLCKSYNVIHFFSADSFNRLLECICKLRLQKCIYSVCGFREAYNIGITKRKTKTVRRLLKGADYVDLLNPAGEKYVKKFSKGKVYITPGTFTDLDRFRPQKKEKCMVYAAARLDESKNPMLLIEAINLCQKPLRKKGYTVVLLGKGALQKRISTKIIDYGIEDVVVMKGYDRTSDYTPEAEVFFSLQMMENYPSQSLAEAIASGCYVIVTDVGDSRLCADESFATFIEATPKNLAEAIIKYTECSQEQRKRYANNARLFANKHYSIRDSHNYYKRLIREATGVIKKKDAL